MMTNTNQTLIYRKCWFSSKQTEQFNQAQDRHKHTKTHHPLHVQKLTDVVRLFHTEKLVGNVSCDVPQSVNATVDLPQLLPPSVSSCYKVGRVSSFHLFTHTTAGNGE